MKPSIGAPFSLLLRIALAAIVLGGPLAAAIATAASDRASDHTSGHTSGHTPEPAPERAPALAVGDPAPDFELAASDGKLHRLADYRGRQAVVIAWFPMAFTTGCTIECKSLAEDGDQIERFDVTYFMASVDPVEGEKGNRAFAKAHAARFPILSDPTKKTAAAYGVLSERGYANRWTFYVGKDGRIAFIDKDVSSRLATSARDMAKKLGELGVAAKSAK